MIRRVVLTFPQDDAPNGIVTIFHTEYSREGGIAVDVMYRVMRLLYSFNWIMSPEYIRDSNGSDVLDRVVFINPRAVKG